MFKNAKICLLSALVFMINAIAVTGVSSRSLLLLYEPDAPECLKKDL